MCVISSGASPLVSTQFCFTRPGDSRDLHSFPTRRSSDLEAGEQGARLAQAAHGGTHEPRLHDDRRDRKSTRLNSSHRCISYAVFCLKKKNTEAERGSSSAVRTPSQMNAEDRRLITQAGT